MHGVIDFPLTDGAIFTWFISWFGMWPFHSSYKYNRLIKYDANIKLSYLFFT